MLQCILVFWASITVEAWIGIVESIYFSPLVYYIVQKTNNVFL